MGVSLSGDMSRWGMSKLYLSLVGVWLSVGVSKWGGG